MGEEVGAGEATTREVIMRAIVLLGDFGGCKYTSDALQALLDGGLEADLAAAKYETRMLLASTLDAERQAAAEQEREQCAIEAEHWYDGKAAAKAIRARSTAPPTAEERG